MYPPYPAGYRSAVTGGENCTGRVTRDRMRHYAETVDGSTLTPGPIVEEIDMRCR